MLLAREDAVWGGGMNAEHASLVRFESYKNGGLVCAVG